jgi:hypothetical protein
MLLYVGGCCNGIAKSPLRNAKVGVRPSSAPAIDITIDVEAVFEDIRFDQSSPREIQVAEPIRKMTQDDE